MHKFDTKVQLLKYKVLREIARLAWNDSLLENVTEIPKIIAPGKIPTMRCCVYKERAILSERVRLAIGGNKHNKKVIEVIDIACEDCPTGGYEVTSACRGCLAHRCEEVCKRDAITFDRQKAYIDKTKCVECGACAKACPYSAIHNFKRPCEQSCKVKAITVGKSKEAVIDYEKCTSCGACVYTCPFGAITDRSYILDAIDIIQKSDGGRKYPVYAILAPSVAGQFPHVTLGRVVAGIRRLGFTHVVEVAVGADMVAANEAKELAEKGFLLSSCCPAFVTYAEKNFESLKENISRNLSPAGTLAAFLKQRDPTARVVFLGPCTAKKAEFQREEYRGVIDCVLTFEELQALFDSRDLDLTTLNEATMSDASPYGRRFARSGGVAEAVARSLEEQGLDFPLSAVSCNGIEECRTALQRASRGVLPNNFIEGMACVGGCIGGAGCLTHGEKNLQAVEGYGSDAPYDSILAAVAEQTK